MLNLLLEINYAIDSRFNKRIGLKKRIYNVITDAMIHTPRDSTQSLFSHEAIIDKELTSLFIAYKKNYNLNITTMKEICGNAVRIINDLCYIMNERSVYCSNLYNNISSKKFTDKILAEAFKDA